MSFFTFVIGNAAILVVAQATASTASNIDPDIAQGSETSVTRVATTMTTSLDVPDEIVPAVMPYVNCVHAKSGVPAYSGGKLLDLSDQPEDCARVRELAVKNGVRLLRSQRLGENDKEREARVLQFLSDFDKYSERLGDPPSSSPPAGANIVRETVPAFPEEYSTYFDCKLTGAESTVHGKLEFISYKELKETDCSSELEVSKAKFRKALYAYNPYRSTAYVDGHIGIFDQTMKRLANGGTLILSNMAESANEGFSVPPGMWEYVLCKHQSHSLEMWVDGQVIKPRFPDDEGCAQSREFSKREALTRLGGTDGTSDSAAREEIVERYFREIDQRYVPQGSK